MVGTDDNDLAELEALAAHDRCRAIGETVRRPLFPSAVRDR